MRHPLLRFLPYLLDPFTPSLYNIALSSSTSIFLLYLYLFPLVFPFLFYINPISLSLVPDLLFCFLRFPSSKHIFVFISFLNNLLPQFPRHRHTHLFFPSFSLSPLSSHLRFSVSSLFQFLLPDTFLPLRPHIFFATSLFVFLSLARNLPFHFFPNFPALFPSRPFLVSFHPSSLYLSLVPPLFFCQPVPSFMLHLVLPYFFSIAPIFDSPYPNVSLPSLPSLVAFRSLPFFFFSRTPTSHTSLHLTSCFSSACLLSLTTHSYRSTLFLSRPPSSSVPLSGLRFFPSLPSCVLLP